jgi:hypothetical protein
MTYLQQHESPVWQASRKWQEHTSVGWHWWRRFPSVAICVRQNLVIVKTQLESEIFTAVTVKILPSGMQCLLLAICLACSLTLKMEAVYPSKSLVKCYHTKRSYIPWDNTLLKYQFGFNCETAAFGAFMQEVNKNLLCVRLSGCNSLRTTEQIFMNLKLQSH